MAGTADTKISRITTAVDEITLEHVIEQLNNHFSAIESTSVTAIRGR